MNINNQKESNKNEQIIIPKSTTISSLCFFEKRQLEEIILPTSLNFSETIFPSKNKNIESLSIPSSITTIPKSAFYCC